MSGLLTFELGRPDIAAWRAGNTGVEGVWHFDSGRSGPAVMISALVHGNELCGAFFPSWADQLREVRVYRRGHPMPMSAPGSWSKLQKLTPLDDKPVYFSHTDNSGTVSDLYEAALGGIKAAEKALTHI